MENLAAILREYQYYGWLAFAVTIFLTPLAIRAAHRFGILDIPDQKLKPHARPIPYLGGTAICVAWSATILAATIAHPGIWTTTVPLLLGGIAMSVLGLVDDARGVSPKVRLLVGAIVIAVVISLTHAGSGLVDAVTNGLSVVVGTEVHVPDAVAMALSMLVGVFIVLGACNSANLIDGLDGLCSGVTAIISLGFFLLAAHLGTWGYSPTTDPVRMVLAIAMFGAALGFLPWNFNPARIFMGDAGSVLLGYNCGMLILLFAERGTLRWVVGALMIFALPVFDTMLAMVRRWRAGRSIFEGDRSHFYDQLVQRGFSVRQTVLVCYALTVVYAAIGLLVTWVIRHHVEEGVGAPIVRTRYTIPLYVGVCLLTAFLAWRSGLTNPEEPRAPRQRKGQSAGR
jgi:UDP-GlcNAc:undecaprenyl-phosphate/decaprenyl-phosphate GlcNAc-1-phosphate transferase